MTFHVVFPAAGVGERFGSDQPKQYFEIAGHSVMWWTLNAFKGLVDGCSVLAVSPEDDHHPKHIPNDVEVAVTHGGATRAETVLNALQVLQKTAKPDDWVLVHDIARPCVHPQDIERLIAHCSASNQGAILSRKLTDTIKQCLPESTHIETLDRDWLWAALTPQCFQLGRLYDALLSALKSGHNITDEASAMELAGEPVGLVESIFQNPKLTLASDAAVIEFNLRHQGRC